MTWKTAYIENRVLSASPLELISILYEHAILCVREARVCLSKGEINSRSAAIAKVIAIISELDGSLDHKSGAEIAVNLAKLYQYMRERLMAASAMQDDEPLREMETLLTTLGEAWRAIETSGTAASPQAPEKDRNIPWSGVLPVPSGAAQVAHSWSA